MHDAHRASGADEDATVVLAQITVGGDPRVALARIRAGRAAEADEVVVDAADVQGHLARDLLATQDDTHGAAGADQERGLLDRVGVRAKEHNVVELALHALDGIGRNAHDLGGLVLGGQGVDIALSDDQQAAAVSDVVALGPRVGALDGRPGLDEADSRSRRALRHVDEELFTVRGHDAALVDDNELLEGAVEVVAESAVRLRGAQVLPVGLDQQTVANREVRDLLTDLHDADDGLVAGRHGLLVRVVGRNVLEGIQVDTRHHIRLARVAIELVEQLRIGEANAAGFDLEHDLRRANGVNGLRRVNDELFLADDLNRVLGGGNLGHD